MDRRTRRRRWLPLGAVLAVASSAPALAQDEPRETSISAIDAGQVSGLVTLEGAALLQMDDDTYLFSDGTGVTMIAVGEPADTVPLFTLIGVDGTVGSDEIDVSSWAELPVIKPAVVTTRQQTIDAFWNWIITYGSQDPTLTE